MTDPEVFTNQYELYRKAVTEATQRNKAVVFDLLQGVGLTRVHVTFDGEGDSGQIEAVEAYAGDQRINVPATPLAIEQVGWGESTPVVAESSLREAIETLCYEFLAQEHDGWENNDGACGEFEFDVAERMIELEFNSRYTDVYTSNHSF